MNQMLSFIDSLLFAVKPKEPTAEQLIDPADYIIVTQRYAYCGKIIFQDDAIIKFRTVELKPVKILKRNIKQIRVAGQEQ